jgi:hypothetical protein
MAQTQQEVNIMLTILMDASRNTEGTDCGDSDFTELRAGLLAMLQDPDVIPHNGNVALGVYFYGGPPIPGVNGDACDWVTEAFPITHITSETEITLTGGAIGGEPRLYSAMVCVGEHIDEAEGNDFDAAKRILLVIPHGYHVDPDPADIRGVLLAGVDPTVHEIDGLACESQYDPADEDAETYLLNHIVGDATPLPWSYRLPYEVGEGDYAVGAGHFYAVPSTPCPADPASIERFRLQLKILTRVLLSRCLYDVVGIKYYPDPDNQPNWFIEYGDGMLGQPELGFVLANYEEDPFDPLADLDNDQQVGQSDLGLILANYTCGTRYAQ